MRRTVVSVAALAAGAAAQSQRPGTCDPDYDCMYTFVGASGALYEYDFTHLCSPMGMSTNDTSGHMYHFNLCGTTYQECLPKDYDETYATGTAIQFWGSPPSCNLTAPECTDPFTGNPRCCTAACEVLGVGTPLWTLQDPSNPSTGGVNLTYTGVPLMNDDNNKCGTNPKTGAQYTRSVTYQINCDLNVAYDRIEVDAVGEPETCQYLIQLRTGAACGCTPDCYNKNCGPDGCGGFCSGNVLGGDCPGVDTCQSDQTCCRPDDCTNRDCGDNGCGGSCGTCGDDQMCSQAQVCVTAATNVPASAQIVYGQAHGALFGSWFGGVAVSAVVGGALFLFTTAAGKLTLARYRAGGVSAAWTYLAAGGAKGGEDAAGLVAANAAAASAGSTGAPAASATTGLTASSGSKFGGYGGL